MRAIGSPPRVNARSHEFDQSQVGRIYSQLLPLFGVFAAIVAIHYLLNW